MLMNRFSHAIFLFFALFASSQFYGNSLLTIGELQLQANAKQQSLGEVIPIDAARNYCLRLEVRGTGEEGATFWPILEQSDGNHLPIAAFQLNAFAGTETTLLRDARPGDTELLVADASKWQPPEVGKIVAFMAAADLSDLPNRNIEYYVQKISEQDGKWLLTMSRPIQRAWAAGTTLRQHRDGGYMTFGLLPINLTSDWQQVEGCAFAAPVSEDRKSVV